MITIICTIAYIAFVFRTSRRWMLAETTQRPWLRPSGLSILIASPLLVCIGAATWLVTKR